AAPDAFVHRARDRTRPAARGVRQPRRRRHGTLAPQKQVPACGRDEDAGVACCQLLGARAALARATGEAEIPRKVALLVLEPLAEEHEPARREEFPQLTVGEQARV